MTCRCIGWSEAKKGTFHVFVSNPRRPNERYAKLSKLACVSKQSTGVTMETHIPNTSRWIVFREVTANVVKTLPDNVLLHLLHFVSTTETFVESERTLLNLEHLRQSVLSLHSLGASAKEITTSNRKRESEMAKLAEDLRYNGVPFCMFAMWLSCASFHRKLAPASNEYTKMVPFVSTMVFVCIVCFCA